MAVNPVTKDVGEVSEDWINKFERYASDASSDQLRVLYGKLLSGEIRNPNSVQPSTLHFVAMLNEETTGLIERVLPFVVSDGSTGFIFPEAIQPKLNVYETTVLEQSGFWTADKNLTINKEGAKVFALTVNQTMTLKIDLPKENSPNIQVCVMTRAGCDLASIINRSFDEKSIADWAFSFGATQATFLQYSENKEEVVDARVYKPEPPSAASDADS